MHNNFTIVNSYIDEGISGRVAEKRPAFMQMIDDSEAGDFQAVLIYDSSRFARNLKDAIVYKAILKSRNVELISITEPILDDDSALITDAIMGAINEMYSRKLSTNVKRGLEQKALRNESMTKPPLGYCLETPSKPLQIVEDEAEIIRYIFQSYKQGSSPYIMAKKLSGAGVKTKRGNPIDSRQIEYVLTNPIYKGWLKLTVNGKSYCSKANHSAIIEEDLFDAVQDMYQTKKSSIAYKAKPKEWYRHWLSGMVRCSVCGSTYAYSPSYGGRSDNFRCTKRAKGACSNKCVISVPKLSNVVLEELKRYANNPSSLYTAHISRIAAIKTDYDGELKKIYQMLKRAKDAYLDGVDSIDEYRINKRNLETRLSEIEKEKDCQQNANSLNPEEFSYKILDAIEIISSECDMHKKIDAAHSVLEKIVLDGNSRTATLYFWW